MLGCNVQEIVYSKPGGRRVVKSTVLEVLDEILFRAVIPRVKGTEGAATLLGKSILAGTIKDTQAMSFDLADQFKNEAQDTSGAFQVKDANELKFFTSFRIRSFSDRRPRRLPTCRPPGAM